MVRLRTLQPLGKWTLCGSNWKPRRSPGSKLRRPRAWLPRLTNRDPKGRAFRLCNTTRYGQKFRRRVDGANVIGVLAVETHLDAGQSEEEQRYWGHRG